MTACSAASVAHIRSSTARLESALLLHHAGFSAPPPPPAWADVTSGNASRAAVPTTIVFRGEIKNTPYFHVPVRFQRAASSCSAWIDRPAYLMQVRYGQNLQICCVVPVRRGFAEHVNRHAMQLHSLRSSVCICYLCKRMPFIVWERPSGLSTVSEVVRGGTD